MQKKSALLVLMAAATLIPAASAGVVYSIAPIGPAPAPGDFNDAFEVLLSNSGPSAISVAAFTFGVTTTDTDITFASANMSTTAAPYIFLNNSFDALVPIALNASSGRSLLASDLTADSSNLSIGGGQTLALGRVFYNVASNAALGPFTVSFTTNGGDNSLSMADGTDVPITTLQSTQITIQTSALPEPASFLLIPGGLLLIGWRKRAAQRPRV